MDTGDDGQHGLTAHNHAGLALEQEQENVMIHPQSMVGRIVSETQQNLRIAIWDDVD